MRSSSCSTDGFDWAEIEAVVRRDDGDEGDADSYRSKVPI